MEDSLVPSLAGMKLVDAPLLFFVLSHKAFRRELEELRRIAVEAADSFKGSLDGEFVNTFCRRLEYFKIVCKYHSAAEDELIFTALDTRVKNVVSAYSLEHKSIDEDFNSVFDCLDLLRQESDEIPSLFQKLIFCIGTIQRALCQHMLKEEKQVFHLLIQQFTPEEQAKLLWQYMYSLPVVMLEDILQSMACSLPPDEQIDLLQCMKIVIPKEELFHEVVISWLENKKQSLGPCNMYGKEVHFYGGQISFKEILHMYPGKLDFGEEQKSKRAYSSKRISRQNPFDKIHIWSNAIRGGLGKVLDEIYEIRSTHNLSNLSSTVILLQFFMDVLIFYSILLDRIYYPVMNELSKNAGSLSGQQLVDENQVARIVKLLQSKVEDWAQMRDLLEWLYREVELLVRGISKILIFLETEVFPLISKNCSHEVQMWLLYIGLQAAPLGLLKCTVLWYSATLSEDQFKSILDAIKVESPLRKKYFSSLLREWFRTGYLGKTSIDQFRKDLQGFSIGSHFFPEQFGNDLQESSSIRSRFLSGQKKADIKLSDFGAGVQATTKVDELQPKSARNTKNGIWNPSSSFPSTNEKLEVSYSGKTNLQLFFPGMWKNTVPVPKYPVKYGTGDNLFTPELRLADHVFFFHKVLTKYLEEIVLLSAKLSNDVQIFPDFQRCFQRLQLLYDIHSEIEDGIVFPRLESKGKLKNVTHSYTMDHELESDHFKKILLIANEISTLHGDPEKLGQRRTKYHHLCLELHGTCLSMQRIFSDHFNREETELGPLFGEYFSPEEQNKIIGDMLGRTNAETLQDIIPWLMSCLRQDEQHTIMSLWRKVTKSTNFHEWLGEWWEGIKVFDTAKGEKESSFSTSLVADPLEIVSKYLWKDSSEEEGNWQHKGSDLSEKHSADHDLEHSQFLNLNKAWDSRSGQKFGKNQDSAKLSKETEERNCNKNVNCPDQAVEVSQQITSWYEDHPSVLNQKDLETVIRRISRDSTLDSQKKSHLIQSLLMSRWTVTQQRTNAISAVSISQEEDIGQCPSYQDSSKLTFGCKHYKRNCKLLATCCNKLYTCIRCHDELTDHSVDRKAITKMMCMKCMTIQPIGPKCSNLSCNNFSMARYYCKICKLFDDERQIYHCPYCNLCRLGKGLGIDYFHCMNCNACMSRSLSVHICREKCFEDNCPICHEYIFTSSSPVKALPCGHLMHSTCFQEYTCSNYTCPICSKSLGDMQVYFGMLDALLAEEKIPEEYSGQTQVILCNDCEKKGSAPFHWLYHKCPHCGSYNTRLL